MTKSKTIAVLAVAPNRQSVGSTRVPGDPGAGALAGPSLGERITAARERARLTKADLARACGTQWQRVHAWERGTNEPAPGSLRAIAEVTGVTVDELLGVAEGQDPPFEAWAEFKRTTAGQGLSPGELRALRAFAWPPGTRPTVAAYYGLLAGMRQAEPRG